MSKFDAIQDKANAMVERVQDYLETLSVRERAMVIVGAIIVIVALVGSALWSMHAAANAEQKRLSELKDTLVWMQTNAVTMKSGDDLNLTTMEKVQRAAQQQGLPVAAQEVGEQIQIVAEHAQYSSLANFLTAVAQTGLSIEKLELNKSGQQIKLTATVQ